MPPDTAHDAREPITVRLDPQLRAELADLAMREHTSLEDFLAEIARTHVAAERQRAFRADAERQSLVIAAQARDPHGDEAEVMRWIEDVADTEGWEA